jgi:hypothetical protein
MLSLAAPYAQAPAAPKVTSPKTFFGHEIGADYVLPNYTKFTEYVKKLDAESDRMIVQSIGKTAEGRDQLMAIITAPENFKKLDRYKEISRRLSHAEGLTDDQARLLAKEGKAVIWIDGGLHATEVLGAQQLIETIWQFNSKTDEETLRILRDVIILATHANPDGMELVSDWYMRKPNEKDRSTGQLPRLYQKYVGHDNNRDFYMMNQPESVNMNRILYREWFPQIMYNHHQTGPTGTVMFSPPFRDPFNYVYDPIVVNTLDQVGAAMHTRFDVEGKPGVTTRSGSNYSTWWNGGLRTMAYFHNQVGLLTESIGNPTPERIGFVPDRVIARGDLPFPIMPTEWHFRQSIDYSITANYAVLDFAQRYRESLLFNIYKAGQNSIARGSKDSWTIYPRRIAEVKETIAQETRAAAGAADSRMTSGGRIATVPDKYFELIHKPENRDPRGYILSASEGDFLTATKFVNIMIKSGLTAHRATAPFTVAGKQYPAGSYVFKASQAFRPHLLDMFEPQDHPNDFQYPGGPPIPPYDSAGWTLAYQMGLKFDRILDTFDGPFEKVADVIKPAPGKVTDAAGAVGFVVNHRNNDAFIAVNRLLKANEDVSFVADRTYQSTDGTGVIFIAAKPTTKAVLDKAAAELGLNFTAVTTRPSGATYKLTRPRIGLWDQYGGSMPSGHLRWLLEQFEFDFERVFPATLDAGNLKAKYDVILFPDGGIPERDGGQGGGGGFGGGQPQPQDIPAEYRPHLGRVTIKSTVPKLKEFAEAGGVIVAFGGSAVLGHHMGLPVSDHLVEVTQDGEERPLPGTKYYIPGGVLRVAVDNTNPTAFGFEKKVDVFFDNSPVMELAPDASLRGVKTVAWFDSKSPLRSGWAWGQHYLEGGTAGVEAQVGKGKVFLFGPEITFRAQPHGTFKFLFNSIFYGTSVASGAGSNTTTIQ